MYMFVVQFYRWYNLVFLCFVFLIHYHILPCARTIEKIPNLTKGKTELQHIKLTSDKNYTCIALLLFFFYSGCKTLYTHTQNAAAMLV